MGSAGPRVIVPREKRAGSSALATCEFRVLTRKRSGQCASLGRCPRGLGLPFSNEGCAEHLSVPFPFRSQLSLRWVVGFALVSCQFFTDVS